MGPKPIHTIGGGVRFGVQAAPIALRRFWRMVAHHHGQSWNASEIGRSLGEAHTTVKRHLDILCGAMVMRQLPPWFENLAKRQVRSPKAYLRDSGLLHELLGIPSFAALEAHPKLGASWEGFALEEVLRITGDRGLKSMHGPAERIVRRITRERDRPIGSGVPFGCGARCRREGW